MIWGIWGYPYFRKSSYGNQDSTKAISFRDSALRQLQTEGEVGLKVHRIQAQKPAAVAAQVSFALLLMLVDAG